MGSQLAVPLTSDTLVISVADFKIIARIDGSTEDAYLSDLLLECQNDFQRHTNMQLLTATITDNHDRFPDALTGVLLLERRPAASVTSITYYDTAGTSQTFSSSSYLVSDTDERSRYTRVKPAPGYVWPGTQLERLNAVTVTYSAGFGATGSSVPDDIQGGLRHLAAWRYRYRDEEGRPGTGMYPTGWLQRWTALK